MEGTREVVQIIVDPKEQDRLWRLMHDLASWEETCDFIEKAQQRFILIEKPTDEDTG